MPEVFTQFTSLPSWWVKSTPALGPGMDRCSPRIHWEMFHKEGMLREVLRSPFAKMVQNCSFFMNATTWVWLNIVHSQIPDNGSKQKKQSAQFVRQR